MEELREEVGVKKSFKRKLVRSWSKWAGHKERLEWLTKREDSVRVEGRRRIGRPRLRWEDFGRCGRGVEKESEG